MSLEDIDRWLAVLHRHGVQRFSMADGSADGLEFEVTFESKPAEAQTAKEIDGQLHALASEPEKCACGHAEYQHQGSFCILGCSAEQCAPEETQVAT